MSSFYHLLDDKICAHVIIGHGYCNSWGSSQEVATNSTVPFSAWKESTLHSCVCSGPQRAFFQMPRHRPVCTDPVTGHRRHSRFRDQTQTRQLSQCHSCAQNVETPCSSFGSEQCKLQEASEVKLSTDLTWVSGGYAVNPATDKCPLGTHSHTEGSTQLPAIPSWERSSLVQCMPVGQLLERVLMNTCPRLSKAHSASWQAE